ncbi:MAG: transposase [Elusimicrobia bacterium]|nr:transposase [Elusimicrobiota bacterium]
MEETRTATTWAQALNELGAILRLDTNQAELMLDEAARREPHHCRRCGNEDRIYRLSGGRLRCAKCRYSFRAFTGRWLGRHRLPATVWLAAIKCFELGLGAQELSQVAGLSLLVRAVACGGNVTRAFKIRHQGDGIRVEPLPSAGDDEVRIDLPPAGQTADQLRVFRAGIRRWMRLSPDRLALKLKEWEVRSNRRGSLFELALEALVRYMPEGVADA